jgi:hypothetical protein
MTDGCAVHLLYNSSWKLHQHAAGQLLSGQPRYGTKNIFTLKNYLSGQVLIRLVENFFDEKLFRTQCAP